MRSDKLPSLEFKRLMREIAMLMAYEVTADLETDPSDIETARGKARGAELRGERPVVVPILRSGLVMAEGIQEVMPRTLTGHIGIHRDKNRHEITEYFTSLPIAADRIFIVVDPVIATGETSCRAIESLQEIGVEESRIRFVSLVVSAAGRDRIVHMHRNVKVYCASIDRGNEDDEHHSGLNDSYQVMPGIGSVSERLFGFKTSSINS